MFCKKPTVEISENGPILISSKTLTVSTPSKTSKHTTIAICRCGHSDNKPFCDGTHSKIGFTADKAMITF